MSTADYMMDAITRFRKVLDKHDMHMKLFCQHAVQVEGWLKGELLRFLDAEKTSRELDDYWPECTLKPRTAGRRRRIETLTA